MKNRLLYKKLINNISRSIYKSINENYFSLNNLLKNNNISQNAINNYYKLFNDKLNNNTFNEDDYNEIKDKKFIVYEKDTLKKLLEFIIFLNIKYNNIYDLNWIDTSRITDMSWLFSTTDYNDRSVYPLSMPFKYPILFFNGDISLWDVSNVTNMRYMFAYSTWNGNISNWDTSNVVDMDCMFNNSNFNSDISNWNVSNVNSMCSMFFNSLFNNDISEWDVSNVTNMVLMFALTKFNKNISSWKINRECDTFHMFYKCKILKKNRPIEY